MSVFIVHLILCLGDTKSALPMFGGMDTKSDFQWLFAFVAYS